MAAFDLGNKQSLDRLHKAKKTSREALEPFRHARTEFTRDFVGSWYSTRGSKALTYVNKLNQTARIYSMALAFNNPQCKVTSFNPDLWPFCSKFEVNINKLIEAIDFNTTFQAGVLDAFFLMGIFKVRMADSGYVQTEDNVWINPGKPWMDRVSPDDLILDMGVKDVRVVRYIGDRYRVSYDSVMERDDFDRKVRDRITPTSKSSYDSSSERASDIATGSMVDDDELEPMCWLEDVYLPETRQIATFYADDDSLPPLKVIDDDSGPLGPYETLGLGLVPDNVIPCSPAANLKALHDLANRLYRKLAAQANRQKTVSGYASGAEDDAKRRRDAKDGEYFHMRDVKSVVDFSTPGVDGNTNAFFLAAQEIYNIQAGNERSIGGLGAESDTVGQEQMIQSHSAGMIAYMKGACNTCAGRLCRKIGHLMFEDESLTVESSMEAESTGYYVDTSWRPGDRKGIKDHYNFSVDPSSMPYRPPEAKLQFVMQFWQQVGNLFPLVQAGLLDINELTRFASEYGNVPELQRMAKYMQQASGGEGGGGGDPHQATKPAVTTRETVRRGSSSGQGVQGSGMTAVLGQMMQGMRQGGGQQQTMTAGAGR